MAYEKKETKYSVLHQRYSAGPHGLGDPDDKYLRKVEKDILISKIVRSRSRDEKCISQVKNFNECCINNGITMTFFCQKENKNLKDCLLKWYEDKEFRKECTEQYLKERSEYRSTGEPKKIREFREHAANSFK